MAYEERGGREDDEGQDDHQGEMPTLHEPGIRMSIVLGHFMLLSPGYPSWMTNHAGEPLLTQLVPLRGGTAEGKISDFVTSYHFLDLCAGKHFVLTGDYRFLPDHSESSSLTVKYLVCNSAVIECSGFGVQGSGFGTRKRRTASQFIIRCWTFDVHGLCAEVEISNIFG